MIERIFAALREFKAPAVFNPWREVDPLDLRPNAPEQRCTRLLAHLNVQPRLLLIGEAAGYQGCHFSGVPFTCEKLLCEGVIPRLTSDRRRFTKSAEPWNEPSDTVVWAALQAAGLQAEAVLWNAFPWHPHLDQNKRSNRPPNRDELREGAKVLRMLLDHFGAAAVIGVGDKAEWTLNFIDFRDFAKVRHPAMGGAKKFRAGFAAAVSVMSSGC